MSEDRYDFPCILSGRVDSSTIPGCKCGINHYYQVENKVWVPATQGLVTWEGEVVGPKCTQIIPNEWQSSWVSVLLYEPEIFEPPPE